MEPPVQPFKWLRLASPGGARGLPLRAGAVLLVSLILAVPRGAHGQTLEEARAFTLGLYRAYAHGSPDVLGPQAGDIFARPLLDLIRQDQTSTPAGDVGTLDGDPICDCQDAADVSRVSVEVSRLSPSKAKARVRFALAGEPRTVRLDLTAVAGRWRVEDVRTKDTPSLVGLLRSGERSGAGHRSK